MTIFTPRRLFSSAFAVVLIAIALLFAISCSSSSDDNPDNSGSSGDSSNSSGTLRLPGGDPITLDPALASDAESARYIAEIFSGLVTLDQNLNVSPDIAEKWDVSDDGTVYTFHLRTNALFHDGSRRVTANDFKYSMERALNADTQSTTAVLYLGDIVGAKEYANGRAQEVTGIKVIDPNTLEITIDAAKPYFLSKLSYPTAYVVDKNQVEANERSWFRRPNGTGPYKLQEWRLGERITLTANDRFYNGPPSVKQVVFNMAIGSSLTAYENNELDMTGVGINDIERVRDPREPLNSQYSATDQLDIWYIEFNSSKPPFDDPKVRQAFTYAIDKDKLVKVVLLDAVRKANGILPPGMPGYNPNLQGLGYDPNKAKQLLSESKYGGASGLPPVTLISSGQGASLGPSSEAILAMWEDTLGVKVEVQQSEFATFIQQIRRGDFQMAEQGWIADYVDPEDFLDIKLHSGSTDNYGRYSNAEFDRLVEQARTERDSERRISLYRQAEQIAVTDAAWIPLYHSVDNVLIKPYVKDYKVTPLVIPNLRYVHLEQ